jgi:hypothetical protein
MKINYLIKKEWFFIYLGHISGHDSRVNDYF